MAGPKGSLMEWATRNDIVPVKQQSGYVFRKSELTEVQFPKGKELSELKSSQQQLHRISALNGSDTTDITPESSPKELARSHVDMVKMRHGFPPYRLREREILIDVFGDETPTNRDEHIQHFGSLPACFTTDRLGFKEEDVDYYSELSRFYRGPLITDPTIWETLRGQDIYYETQSTRVIMQRMLRLLIERGDVRAAIRELDAKSSTAL